MKKFLLLFSVLFASIASYGAEPRFYLDNDLKIKKGETKELSFKLENDAKVKGFQITITLPEGLTFVGDEEEEAIATDRIPTGVSCAIQDNDNRKLMVAFAATNASQRFAAGDGDIFTCEVKADENATLGTPNIELSEMLISLTTGNFELADANFSIKIYTTYTITASPNKEAAGSVTGAGEYENGTNATLTATANEGYQFTKWSNDVTDNPYTFAVNAATDLTAQFDAINYNLSYELAGGAVATENPASYTIESEAITLNNPTKTGYDFAGWTGTDLTAATTTVTIAKGSTGDRSYTATWTPTVYQIQYNYVGGSAEGNPSTYTIETESFTLVNPTLKGYTFAGWTEIYSNTDRGMTVTIEKGSTGKLLFQARWTLNTYTIDYELNGGTVDGNNPTTFTVNSDDITLINPTKTGYTFAGWTGTGLTAATQTVTIAKGSVDNRSYTANWTINQYTITFDTDGGSAIAAITQDYNSAVTAPSAPTKTGYTFAGWDKEIPATMPAENITIKALWTINQYTITFDTDGGSAIAAITQDYNSAVTAPSAPTKTGYTFAGWDKEIPATMPAENITIKALWTLNTYTITYDLDEGAWEGGTNPNPASYTVLSEDITLVAPVREGYSFTGWTGTGLTEPTMVVVIAKGSTENRSYKATWQLSTGINAILSNGKKLDVYTIDGRLVKRGMTADEVRQSLRSGMYIINGKKVVLK